MAMKLNMKEFYDANIPIRNKQAVIADTPFIIIYLLPKISLICAPYTVEKTRITPRTEVQYPAIAS